MKINLASRLFFAFILLSHTLFGQSGPIIKFLERKGMEHASVGISIVNLQEGTVTENVNAGVALVPASTLKLVTTASALRLFPASSVFPVEVFYTGTISKDGVLNGNLVVRGSGEPTLGSDFSRHDRDQFLREVLASLRTHHIRKITGDVIADDYKPGVEGVSPHWTREDMGNYYAAGCYMLNFGDNKYELTLDTSVAGQQPRVKSVSPPVESLRFSNELMPVSYPFDSAYIQGSPYSNERILRGAVPHGRPEYKIKGDVPDPPLFAAERLHAALEKGGVDIQGDPRTTRQFALQGKKMPERGNLLYTYHSDPLRHIVRVTNQRSNNLYAESLLRLIALKEGDGSYGRGVEEIRSLWKGVGLDTDALFMVDGSGLAPANRVSAGFLTSLLSEMKGDAEFVNSLPVAGKEGTVSSFLENTPLEGRARLKSGSFKNALGYAGYVTGKERYAVAILVNNFRGSNAQLRKAITELLVGLDL